jgi:hypothetical protein
MKRRIRTMHTLSKEGIMVNKSQRGMNAEQLYPQEDLIPPGIKEASFIMKETMEEKIVII